MCMVMCLDTCLDTCLRIYCSLKPEPSIDISDVKTIVATFDEVNAAKFGVFPVNECSAAELTATPSYT